MAEIEFTGEGFTKKWWDTVEDLFKLDNKFEGSVFRISARCGLSVNSFFYREILPVMIRNGILSEIAKEKRAYTGEAASVYHFNRDELTKFCLKHNKRLARIFQVWVVDADADPNWMKKQ